jgi:hypothetical protein
MRLALRPSLRAPRRTGLPDAGARAHPRTGPPLLVLLLAVLAVAGMASARPDLAAAAASWQFAPASAPPPPPGAPAASSVVPLGQVGEISFWSPNRGLLIDEGTNGCRTTSSTAAVPCGLYAYNGAGWHLLSTVCGSGRGRIAWAGPDEFWTISDQRPGQVTTSGGETQAVSLCHFLDGQVVGSYATPLNQPDSYLPMDAAACLSPTDCWFGGALGKGHRGAFHLHWNGVSLTAVYSPEDHAVTSMALADQSTLLESVQLAPGEEYESESAAHPAVLHQLDPPGSSIDFHNLFVPDPSCALLEECPPLPDYGTNLKGEPVAPYTLAGFALSSDYTPSGSNPAPPQLWVAAGPDATKPPSSSKEGVAHTIVLRYSQGAWTQVVGGSEPGGGDPFAKEEAEEVPGELFQGVAAEPGAPAAWLTLSSKDGEAHVDRLSAAGALTRETLGEAQGVGKLGAAGPIACPAANDCWLATTKGWLFHLTEDPAEPERTEGYPVDTDPNFAELITYRPPDEGVPQLPSIEQPLDNSLANQAEPPPPPKPTVQPPANLTRKPLVTDVSSHVVHRYTLELSFKLTVKARVQLLASLKRRRVAHTALQTLRAGMHTLTLRLNPRSWPNKLNLKATPLETLPTVESQGSSGQTVPPPVSANSVST